MPNLHVFYLNFYQHPTVRKYQKLLFEFQDNFNKFIPQFAKERYGVDGINVESYWPAFSAPKTFEALQDWDARSVPAHEYFKDHFQMYITYDINIKYGTPDIEGICTVGRKGHYVTPSDFMFAEMPDFDPTLPVIGTMNPYKFYRNFSRLALHELEHRLMAWTLHTGWISSVDALIAKPLITWDTGKVDSFGNPVVFVSQQDPQKL